jgi:uncharacterized protein
MNSVTFAASGIGSLWWDGGTLLKKSIARLGFELVLDDRSSNHNNVLSVAEGKNVLGITLPQFIDWAQRGLGVYAGTPVGDLRVIAALDLDVWLAAAVERSSGITSLAELAQKRFPWKVVLPASNNLVGAYIDRILSEHGCSRENILRWGGADPPPMRQRTAAERADPAGANVMNVQTRALAQRGAANGFFLYVNGNSEWARDLTTLLDLRFLRFDERILDAINAEWGGITTTLPARVFPGADEDLTVVGYRHHYIYGTADVADDLARAVLAALEDERILDNPQGFSFSGIRPIMPAGIKLHRVAEAYYAR